MPSKKVIKNTNAKLNDCCEYSATFLCEDCRAQTSGILNYKDFRASALHRKMKLSHWAYVRTTAPEDPTPWCQLPDFRKELSREDPQHLVYNGGVASDVSASVIKMVIDAGKFGPPPASAQIDAAYTAFVHDNTNKDRHWPKPWNVNRIRHRLTSHPTFALGYKHGQVRDFLHFAH